MQQQASARDNNEQPIQQLARIIHTGLAPLFIRFGVNYPEQKHILGWSMVNAALKVPEFTIRGRNIHKQTLSHAAILTGMTRREVSALASLPLPDTSEISDRTQRVARILAAWRSQPGYQDDNGEPLVLPIRGPAPSFETLARYESRDTPARAMADVLVSDGNARWEGRKLRLISDLRIPPAYSDEEIYVLAQMAKEFLGTVDALLDPTTINRPRIRTIYFQDISKARFHEMRECLHEEMSAFNARCNELMEKYRARSGEPSIRAGVTSFSFFESGTGEEPSLKVVKD